MERQFSEQNKLTKYQSCSGFYPWLSSISTDSYFKCTYVFIWINVFITSSPDNCTRVCLSTAPVRHMAFGVPGGSTNMTYFVLCGGGLTAAVVYVSIRSGYRRWFLSPPFHHVCTVLTAVSRCYTWIFQVRNLNLCYSVRKRKSLRSFVLISVICVVFLYMSRDQLPCGAAALRFTALSWFRQCNSVISRCYTLIWHFLLQMPFLMPPQRDSCLNWTLMTANIDLTQFFCDFLSHISFS